jgi:hypothetical protein
MLHVLCVKLGLGHQVPSASPTLMLWSRSLGWSLRTSLPLLVYWWPLALSTSCFHQDCMWVPTACHALWDDLGIWEANLWNTIFCCFKSWGQDGNQISLCNRYMWSNGIYDQKWCLIPQEIPAQVALFSDRSNVYTEPKSPFLFSFHFFKSRFLPLDHTEQIKPPLSALWICEHGHLLFHWLLFQG